MSYGKSLDELNKSWAEFDRPTKGATYRHYKGGLFKIVATGFFEDSETPCVVYYSIEKKMTWVRSAKNFSEKVEYRGEIVPRFTKNG